jgi:hypothetical protein
MSGAGEVRPTKTSRSCLNSSYGSYGTHKPYGTNRTYGQPTVHRQTPDYFPISAISLT